MLCRSQKFEFIHDPFAANCHDHKNAFKKGLEILVSDFKMVCRLFVQLFSKL